MLLQFAEGKGGRSAHVSVRVVLEVDEVAEQFVLAGQGGVDGVIAAHSQVREEGATTATNLTKDGTIECH